MMFDKTLRDLSRHHAFQEVYWPNPAEIILPKDHFGLYRFVAEHIGVAQKIDYFEFGVAHGKSIAEMARLFSHDSARFYGFDSFEGLPEKWLMHDVGAFTSHGVLPNMHDKRVEFVKGWFQNSVPEFLGGFQKDPSRPTLIHFDADLYSSTLFLLATLWSKFDSYYFVMDDFIHDEIIAMHHFKLAFPVEIQFFAQTKGGGNPPNPDQVFGHMKRVKFELKGSQ
jgi:hypothetical protein